MKHLLFTLSFILLLSQFSFSQPSRQPVQIFVTPKNSIAKVSLDHLVEPFLFKSNENVQLTVTAYSSGIPMDVDEFDYSLCEDKMPAFKTGKVKSNKGVANIQIPAMKHPGFIRCDVSAKVDGVTYKGSATVGFSIDELKPVVQLPNDFKEWWQTQLDAASKVPMEAKLDLLERLSTDKVNVYQVSIQAFRKGCKVYGILAMPKAEGKYSAIMRLPGAGVYSMGGMISEAEKGYITMDLNIHGIPNNLDNEVYQSLSTGALNDYPSIEIDSRDNYYYRRVYLSCVRAAEYLASLANCDGNVYVCGGSQGGALSIVTAALCPKVTAIEVFFPAMCDQEAYLQNRAGGWPHYFYFHKKDANIQQIASVVRYYDVANFARILKTPIFMSFGLSDLTCAPTSTYSTWNVVGSNDKKLVVTPETGHWRFPVIWNEGWDWMLSHKTSY